MDRQTEFSSLDCICIPCSAVINVVGVRCFNCSLSISLIHKVSNASSEQAEITRNSPMKIALNLPKSLFTQSSIGHTAFSRMSHSNCSIWPPFATTQERKRRRRHCLTALSITRWSNDMVLRLVHSLDFPAINSLLKNNPYFIVD